MIRSKRAEEQLRPQVVSHVASELLKCQQDPVFFIKKYCAPILTSMMANPYLQIPFVLRPYQIDQLLDFMTFKTNIHLQPRSTGATTIPTLFMLHNALFMPNSSVALMFNHQAMAHAATEVLDELIQNLPAFIRPSIVRSTHNGVQFSNGSTITCMSALSNGTRGRSLTHLFIDNLAWHDEVDQEQIWMSTRPSLASTQNHRIILTGTPRGNVGTFADIWHKDPLAHKRHITVADCPQLTNTVISLVKRNISDEQFRREFDCDFSV